MFVILVIIVNACVDQKNEVLKNLFLSIGQKSSTYQQCVNNAKKSRKLYEQGEFEILLKNLIHKKSPARQSFYYLV